ncbi:MAG TPA: hypothetical protein VFU10_08935 [Gaiellaceae bacterium]|nr:hypothetical protein [Gaiellaceae bacterium]
MHAVRAVTSPGNERSIAFHRAVGLKVEAVVDDSDGRGSPRALFVWRRGAKVVNPSIGAL